MGLSLRAVAEAALAHRRQGVSGRRGPIKKLLINVKIKAMKNTLFLSLFLLVAGLAGHPRSAVAQEATSTKISYEVSFGPVFPIEGESNQLSGQIAVNDTTGAVEQLNFEVPLNSFVGQNSGYLAWVGGSWTYPTMRFRSKNIIQTDKGLSVHGTMEFRGGFAPVTIEFTPSKTDKELIFHGTFNLPIRDYFITSPPFDLVPPNIPMKVSLVFDKPLAG